MHPWFPSEKLCVICEIRVYFYSPTIWFLVIIKTFLLISFIYISSFHLWKSAVHHLEEVRMKAIRLVFNPQIAKFSWLIFSILCYLLGCCFILTGCKQALSFVIHCSKNRRVFKGKAAFCNNYWCNWNNWCWRTNYWIAESKTFLFCWCGDTF